MSYEVKVYSSFDEFEKEEANCFCFFLSKNFPNRDKELVKWFDWKLRGKISNLLSLVNEKPLYIYVKKRLSFDYLVLMCGTFFEPVEFLKNLSGLKMDRVLVFFSDSSLALEFEQSLQTGSELPVIIRVIFKEVDKIA